MIKVTKIMTMGKQMDTGDTATMTGITTPTTMINPMILATGEAVGTTEVMEVGVDVAGVEEEVGEGVDPKNKKDQTPTEIPRRMLVKQLLLMPRHLQLQKQVHLRLLQLSLQPSYHIVVEVILSEEVVDGEEGEVEADML